MPTKQVVYPSIWTDPRLLGCSLEAHLAYAYLRPLADHWGRFPLASAWGEAGRRPEISLDRLEGWLLELHQAGVLEFHQVAGVEYGLWPDGSGIPESQRCPSRLPLLSRRTRVKPAPSPTAPAPEAEQPPADAPEEERTPVTPPEKTPPGASDGLLDPFAQDWSSLRKTKVPKLGRIRKLIHDAALDPARVRLVWRDWILNAPKPAHVKDFVDNYGEYERRVVIGARS